LPDQMFYNTGILTYVWIVTNRKKGIRKGKIQLIDGTNFFEKMSKSLGDKRKMLGKTHIEKLTEIYGKFVEGEYCKIFDGDDFAYWKVTVERPLRLNFQTSTERIERIRAQTAFANLSKSRKHKPKEVAKEVAEGERQQEVILTVLRSMDSNTIHKNRGQFTKLLTQTFKKAKLDVKGPLLKAIVIGLSEKDETADICTNAKGNPEPDSDLRDTEQVPVKESIGEYIKREVLPYVPDAWVDSEKTKKGYEIPFTRHFYKYQWLGNADETLREIQLLSNRIQASIKYLSTEEI